MPPRHLAPLVATLVLALVVGCTPSDEESDGPDPAPVAAALAAGLVSGDLGEVDFVGDPDAQTDLDEVLAGMAGLTHQTAVSGVVLGDDDTATASLRWTWEIDGQRWEYDTTADLRLDGDRWQILWEPTIVEKSLRPGTVLKAVTREADRGDILGRDGQRLVTERPVLRIGVDRSQLALPEAVASARELAGLVGVDRKSYVTQVRGAGDKQFVEAIVYRRAQVPPEVQTGYVEIDGVMGVNDRIPLAPTADFAAPILGRVGSPTAEMIADDPDLAATDQVGLSGLEARYEDILGATAGVRVLAVAQDGKSRDLYSAGGGDGEDLATSMDKGYQEAAEAALAQVEPTAALVAIQPSTGEILAAADGPGTGGVNYSTYAQTAPGSTFKLVTTLALLRSGLTPDSTVDCPASIVVDGKRFENYDDYPASALGQVTLREAFANSCNTAFIGAGEDLDDDQLATAAASLGVGVDHDLGFPAYFGSNPAPESETGAAAQRIGQGDVLASPMSMATVMASVVAGETVVPRLVDPRQIESIDVAVPPGVEPLTGAEAATLRDLTGAVVTSGSGAQLADLPGDPVLAKTGTAEFDRDGRRLLHAWMVAGQGDLAVAVYVDEGVSGSQTAGPILEEFLRAVQ